MLIGFIKHNRALSIVTLPVAVTALWFYGFVNPITPSIEPGSPVYNSLISLLGKYPFLLTLISSILIFCEALILNFIAEKNEIIKTTTYLPALAYIILMSLQPEMFSLHPIILSNFFILLALHKLMQTHRKESAYSEAFDAGFFISIASLFYTPSLLFIFIIWIGLLIIRPFIWREWVLSFTGILIPWIYLAFFYFWVDKPDAIGNMLYTTVTSTNKSLLTISFSVSEGAQIMVLLIALFFSAGRFLHDFNTGSVRLRNNLLLLFYFFILSFISIVLAPHYSISYLSFLAIPFSLFFSAYLLFTKKEWQAEVLFLLLIISIFINQFIP
jgi:Family of unknown function (DUF6427)